MPVYAIIPIGIATRKSFHVGATPSWTLWISVCGEEHEHDPDDHEQQLRGEVGDREHDVSDRPPL